MKQNIILLLSLCLLLFSCSDKDDPIKEVEKPPVETKDPFITLKKTNIDFTNEGGSEAILIESNVTWATKSSASWCTVTPTSGNKSTETITLSAPVNKDYDNRSCTVTIESGNITKTITVNQGENLGLLITQDKYELGNEESTIKVEVKANVDFEVEINDKWISKVDTRGLTTSQIEFKIAENDTYGNRNGSITIKQKGGNMSSTITIFQSQEDAIILSEKDFELTSKAQSVELEIKTNIDYEIIIPEDAKVWVTNATTRALRTETVVLDITENKDHAERTAKVIVKNKKTNLQEVVTIKQAANTGLIINTDKYEVSNDGGTIEIEVKANVEFDIEISDDWITQVKTRGLKETKLQFQVAKNQDYDNREGTITIKQKDGNLSSTIKVYQSQKDAIIISEKTFNLSRENQAIEVEVKTNVEFQVIIPEAAKSWVSYTPTRGLRTENLTLNISENKDYNGRSTEVYVKDKKTNLQDTLTIYQTENLGFTVSKEKFDLNNEATTIEVDVEANFDFDVKISDNWITQVETRGLTSTKLIFSIAKNTSYDSREGTITIKQKGGDLSSTIKVYQSQKDAIIISEKIFDLTSEKQAIQVELKTNVEFEMIIPESAKSWVSYTPTRGLRTENLTLNISENNTDRTRSTEVYIKDKQTSLQETLTITQMGNEPGVYYVERMGTLSSMLNQTQKDTITTMIVKGEINKADFDVMKLEMPKLKYIDLKEVKCEGDKIPAGAFGHPSHNKDINTIILPAGIISIGEFAFASCTGLTGDLIIPDGVTTIGLSAFASCTGLTGDLIIPDGVTIIGKSAFARCSGFTGNLILPDGLTTIEDWAFSESSFSGSLILSDKLKTIGLGAFQNCTGFNGYLSFPEGVSKIGRQAFMGCKNFSGSLTLPKGLKEIEAWAFKDCTGFYGSLTIPKGVTSINYKAFQNCSGFRGSLSLPDGLNTIDVEAFQNCLGFTGALILPGGLTRIFSGAFENCEGFTGTLNLPGGLTSIGSLAFSSCYGFTGSLTLPDGLTTIGSNAFTNCINFNGSLNLPDGLTTIGSSAFSGCYRFKGPLILPSGLTTIESHAFWHCRGFTGILNLPDELTTIERQAFAECPGFTGLKFGNNIVSIGSGAFEKCTNISGDVEFPISLESIEEEGFIECYKIDAFRLPHTTPLGYYPNMLPNGATVKVPTSAVDTYKSTDGWKDYNIVGY